VLNLNAKGFPLTDIFQVGMAGEVTLVQWSKNTHAIRSDRKYALCGQALPFDCQCFPGTQSAITCKRCAASREPGIYDESLHRPCLPDLVSGQFLHLHGQIDDGEIPIVLEMRLVTHSAGDLHMVRDISTDGISSVHCQQRNGTFVCVSHDGEIVTGEMEDD